MMGERGDQDRSCYLYKLISEVTHHHSTIFFWPFRANPGAVWKQTIQRHEYQEVEIVGDHLGGCLPGQEKHVLKCVSSKRQGQCASVPFGLQETLYECNNEYPSELNWMGILKNKQLQHLPAISTHIHPLFMLQLSFWFQIMLLLPLHNSSQLSWYPFLQVNFRYFSNKILFYYLCVS